MRRKRFLRPFTGETTRFCNRPSARMLAARLSMPAGSASLRGLDSPGRMVERGMDCRVVMIVLHVKVEIGCSCCCTLASWRTGGVQTERKIDKVGAGAQ